MIKSKKQMYLVIGAFALVLMLGTVTYAFFNYTITGTANVIKTGRISFNSEQGTAINLDNLFPIDPTETGIMNDASKVGTATINVTGDTTYTDGIEYLVSAVNVQNTVGSGVNAKSLPISIDVSVASNTGNDPAITLGTADSDYFTHRGTNADTSIYKVLAGNTISTNDQLVVGYIKSGATGVDGNIVIRAYLDKDKIAITDTYPEGTVHTVKTTNYSSSDCETVLTGVTNASTYCASASSLQSAVDNSDLTSGQITLLVNAGIVEEYTDGTTSTWVNNRTVFTTSEWNSLQQNGVSFQIKIEANEGIWVDAPVAAGTIDSCPGCKFIYTENEYFYSANNYNSTPISTLTTFENNNETLVDDYTTLNKNYFLGFKFDGSGNITNAYACGIKGTDYLNNEEQNPGVNAGTAFCVEGSTDGSTYSATNTFLNDSTTGIWKGRCDAPGSYVNCNGSVYAIAYSYGYVYVADDDGDCDVNNYGFAYCR